MPAPEGTASLELPRIVRCWCGNEDLAPFSTDYRLCTRCSTLVLAAPPGNPARVLDEEASLYGMNYFFEHARELGHPSLPERARLDLPERCVFWLDTLLRYRPPPARTIELGCANGAFVGLLTEAGYQATGLDLSPAVTRFVGETFQVPVLTGPLEEQRLAPGSFDVVVMMDVLEHLPDPVGTLKTIGELLAPDGVLLVQTPNYEPSKTFDQLQSTADPFLAQLKSSEHLFLLSRSSASKLLAQAGLAFLEYVPAIFAQYDMSFVASRAPFHQVPEESRREALRRTRSGRVVEALMAAGKRNQNEIPALRQQIAEADWKLAEVDRKLVEADHARTELQNRFEELTRELERTRLAERESRAQAHQLSTRIDEMAAQILRLRTIEDDYQNVVRRLGFLAKLFGAKRTMA